MSRGHGFVQRGILEAVSEPGVELTISETAASVFEVEDVEPRQYESTRRGAHKLRTEGLLGRGPMVKTMETEWLQAKRWAKTIESMMRR